MQLHTADALILRTYALGESDRIVVFLTSDRGKKRGVAKNARQSRRRFGGALEPLTYGRVGYREREGRDLARLDYVAPIRSPLLAADWEALGYVGYFAELIDEWAPEADPNEALFRLGGAELRGSLVPVVGKVRVGGDAAPVAGAEYRRVIGLREHECCGWIRRSRGTFEQQPRRGDIANRHQAFGARHQPGQSVGIERPDRFCRSGRFGDRFRRGGLGL